jgi:hypothetical protein
MKKRVRVILWIHAFIATYCMACGMLDLSGHYQSWLIPGFEVFGVLLASAVILPILAMVSVLGSGCKHPVVLALTHLAMGAGQLFFGLLPLIS